MTSARFSAASTETGPAPSGAFGEIFRVFLRLGLTSFGGPIAHLGYFAPSSLSGAIGSPNKASRTLSRFQQFLPGPAEVFRIFIAEIGNR
jgi:chromate transporter